MYKHMLLGTVAILALATGIIFAHRHNQPATPINSVAEVTEVENQVRVRSSRSLQWQKAEVHEPLSADDAIYTGRGAKAKLILKHGARIELSENSLLEINALEIPKLEVGNLRLSLQGELKLNLAGHAISLKGQDSEVQLYIEQSDLARLRLLSGSATLSQDGKNFELEKDKVASLERPDVFASPDPILLAHTGVKPLQENNEYFYSDKVEDVYQRSVSGSWLPRVERDPMVAKDILIKWKLAGLPQDLFLQLAQDREFAHPIEFHVQGESFQFQKVFLGNNFWRISTNHKDWADAYFRVTSLPAPGDPPRLRITTRQLHVNAKVSFPIESTTAYRAYLIEVSRTPLFQAQDTETTWVSDSAFLFDSHKAGEYFLRVRGVSQNSEISDFSLSEKLTVSAH